MKIALCLAGKIKGGNYGASAYKVGYVSLNNSLLSKFDVDVFIHAWEPDMEEEIVSLYHPKEYKLESQIDFSDKYKYLNPLYNTLSLSKYPSVFSMLYGRKMSIEIKSKYEEKNNFKYDIVALSRFDLESAEHIIPFTFDNNYDKNCIYFPYFAQTNAGPKDEWFYCNSDNMNYMGTLYDFLPTYMQNDNEFIEKCKTGWPISSPDRFSNEIFKPTELRSTTLETIPVTHILNTHLLYKWHLYKNNQWNTETIKIAK